MNDLSVREWMDDSPTADDSARGAEAAASVALRARRAQAAIPMLPAGESLRPLADKCRENKISRHTIWRLQKRGLGPHVVRLPNARGVGKQLTCDTWWREFVRRLAEHEGGASLPAL